MSGITMISGTRTRDCVVGLKLAWLLRCVNDPLGILTCNSSWKPLIDGLMRLCELQKLANGLWERLT